MEINKHNYEEYFLLYTDNELNAVQREAVERFAEENPSLKEELDGLLQARLSFEITAPAFDKSFLYKNSDTTAKADGTNDHDHLLLYIDNELGDSERKAVEKLATENEKVKQQLELLKRTVITPDEQIRFPDKSLLYRREEKKVVPMFQQWRRMVAAAAILLMGGLVWMNKDAIKEPFEQTGSSSLASLDTNTRDKSPAVENTVKDQAAASTTTEEPVTTNKENNVSPSKTEEYKEPAIASAQVNKQSVNVKKPSAATENSAASVAVADVNQEKLNEVVETGKLSPGQVPGTAHAVTNNKVEEVPVKPFKISQAAFKGDDDKDETTEENINKNKEGIAFLDTDQPGEKSKGNFRGLVRKASRFINRKADSKKEDDSVIRIASFAIAKK